MLRKGALRVGSVLHIAGGIGVKFIRTTSIAGVRSGVSAESCRNSDCEAERPLPAWNGSSLQPSCRFSSAADAAVTRHPDKDQQYLDAVDAVWHQTRQQRKFSSKMQGALEGVLLHDGTTRELLIGSYGFTIQKVHMSPDNMKAYVLWSAYPNCQTAADLELQKRLKWLRAAAAKRLNTRRMPRLEMRLDQLTEEQVALEDIFDQLERERQEDAAEFCESDAEDAAASEPTSPCPPNFER